MTGHLRAAGAHGKGTTVDWYRKDVAELAPGDCWERLRADGVARLAVVVDGAPEIFPINYVVDRETIVFRSGLGTKVSGALEGLAVALEIDGQDRATTTAWSVIVKGGAESVRPGHALMEALQLPLFPWQEGMKDQFVRIAPTAVTGRRFTMADHEAWNSPAAVGRRTPGGSARWTVAGSGGS
ncbi:pyridoxamine 5'-phosphate oxidase family protein [Kocuria arenosa]|uniref:pyridoxamine 5'-phosphate oxidase family protein n=1 Tax=Kocuria arenosa TaxID=3071446 RepID=UPI0034D7352D